MPTISSTSVPSNATTTISSKDRESVRRRLFPSKTFTEIGTQTGPDAAEAEAEADLKCSICLEQTEKKNVTTTACGHMFCTSCLLKHLAVRNTCPNCRTEIESARAPAIEPLNATVVANIIREEETTIDMTRRIAVIGAFQDAEGRASMILSLARELAFGSGHSMAGWQGTSDDTYHASWSAYEYNGIDDDEEDEDEDEDDEGEESDDHSGEDRESNGHGDSSGDSSGDDDDDDDDDESIDLNPRLTQMPSSPFIGEVQELTTPIFMTPTPLNHGRTQVHVATRVAASQRSPFQSPQFQALRHQPMEYQRLIGQPIAQPAVSVEPPIRLNHSSDRGREIDYFDLFIGNFIRVTIFAFFLFVYSR
jgi:hypothetical protein